MVADLVVALVADLVADLVELLVLVGVAVGGKGEEPLVSRGVGVGGTRTRFGGRTGGL